MDMRKPLAVATNTIISLMLVLVFAASSLCYIAIFGILQSNDMRLERNRNVSTGMSTRRRTGRAQKTARTMTTFVMAYMVQYVAYVVYTVWSYFVLPPAALLLANVIMVNSGGVFNALAHTFIKVVYKKAEQESEASQAGSPGLSCCDFTFVKL